VFVERVRGATQALSELTGAASAVGPELVEAIRSTLDEVGGRLDDEETVVALAGEPSAKRMLLNAIVGARAFDPGARPAPEAVVIVRPDRAFDYTASMRDGTVVEFGWRMPAREESFAKAQQRAQVERDAAQAAERDLRDRLESARRAAVEPESPLRRLWRWLQRLMRRAVSMLGRKLLTAAPGETATRADAREAGEIDVAAVEQSLREARTRLQQADARLEALRVERPKYDQERAEAFVQDVRALTDARARGKDVVSLSIACPTTQVSGGFALLDAPEPSDRVHGVIVAATGNGEPSGELVSTLEQSHRPARVYVVRKPTELGPVLDRIRAERPTVAAVRAAASLRACIVRVVEEGARAQTECKRRIAALEGQRIPDPADFRARQMLRVSRAIEDGARDVQKAALECWREAIARTRARWHAGVDACSTREQMKAFVRILNETAREHVETMLDEVSQHAVVELQRVSESIQLWLLEEIRARYHVMRGIEREEAAAAIVGGDIAIAPMRPPLQSALDKFESRRVNLGLGGVAAGAVVGTLIVPGIGTAIGAIVGVFAGLLEGLDSLKRACTARLDKCLDDVEASVAAQITGREAFAEELRASLDQAFDSALAQLDSSISRLMALERRVLDDERKREEELARLRAMLEEQVIRITASSRPPRGAT
jgi:hypothetical protein